MVCGPGQCIYTLPFVLSPQQAGHVIMISKEHTFSRVVTLQLDAASYPLKPPFNFAG